MNGWKDSCRVRGRELVKFGTGKLTVYIMEKKIEKCKKYML